MICHTLLRLTTCLNWTIRTVDFISEVNQEPLKSCLLEPSWTPSPSSHFFGRGGSLRHLGPPDLSSESPQKCLILPLADRGPYEILHSSDPDSGQVQVCFASM